MAVQIVPSIFMFNDPLKYPQDNHEDFEWWCAKNLNPDTERIYLPVTWTAFYKKNKYGQDVSAIAHLQRWIGQTLDKKKKYFTIVQFDDGILNDLSNYNIKVFAMGSPGDYQLPLICQPHAFTFPRLKKDIFCSFVGRITHPIRETIVKQLTGKEGYYISTKSHKLGQFCEVLARSKYVLCPRGYGATSFRICEALQYGGVPIYISDVHLIPHNRIGETIYLKQDEIGIVLAANENHFNSADCASEYNQYFTYEANRDLIIKALSK